MASIKDLEKEFDKETEKLENYIEEQLKERDIKSIQNDPNVLYAQRRINRINKAIDLEEKEIQKNNKTQQEAFDLIIAEKDGKVC